VASPEVLRRLDDRIRDLCTRAIKARGADLESVFAELKFALHEHTERLRNAATLRLLKKNEDFPPERRLRKPALPK
jgi:hypothetical protein